MKFLTKENITLLIAILGLLGNLSSWVYSWFKTRTNISLKLVKVAKFQTEIQGYFMLENNSNLPVSINQVSLLYNSNSYRCDLMPCKIAEKTSRTGKEITGKKSFYSMQFPISLPELSGTSGYLCFEIPQEVLENFPTQLFFLIYTNRGKIIEKTLEFENYVGWEELF